MADVAISYSHRDTPRAEELRRLAISHGLTVWMDEAEPDLEGIESIAIPWGQSHWEVIAREFIRATVVVVIDTPSWRESAYCRREYAFLQKWGKWTALLESDDESELYDLRAFTQIVADFAERSSVASAHARLAQDVQSGGGQRPVSRLDSLLPTARSRDAHLVLSSDLGKFDLLLPPELAEAAKRLVDRSEAAKRRLRRVGAVALVMLLILVSVGGVAWVVSESGRSAAESAASQSSALNLAAQSAAESDTVRAIDLAKQALNASDNDVARAALAVATANDARMQSISVDPADYRGAVLSSDRSVLVAHTTNVILFFEAQAGALKARVEVPDGIVTNTLTVTVTGDAAAFISTADRSVHSVKMDGSNYVLFDGETENLMTPDGSTLWWADASSRLYTAPFSPDDLINHKAGVDQFEIPSTAMALDVESETQIIDLVGRDGHLRSGRITDRKFLEQSDDPVIDPAVLDSDKYSTTDALVIRCGTHVHGYVGARGISGDIRFSKVDGSVRTEPDGWFVMFPPVCQQNGNAWFTSWVGNNGVDTFEEGARPALPPGALRYVTVSGTTSEDAAVITTDGKLLRLGPNSTRRESANGALASIPLDRDPLVVYEEGSVRRESDGGLTGPIGRVAAVTAASLGNAAMIGSEDGLIHFDTTGAPRLILPIETRQLRSLRASSGRDKFVVGTLKSVIIADRDGNSNRTIALPWLAADDSVNDADMSPDGTKLAIATIRGRVAVIDLFNPTATPMFWDRRLPTGTATRLAYSASGDILVIPSDGILMSLSDRLEVLHSLYIGATAVALTIMDQHSLIATDGSRLVVVDNETLETVDDIRDVSVDPRTARLSTDTNSISALSIIDADTGTGSERVYITLPKTGRR